MQRKMLQTDTTALERIEPTVFNAEQIEGLPEGCYARPEPAHDGPERTARAAIRQNGGKRPAQNAHLRREGRTMSSISGADLLVRLHREPSLAKPYRNDVNACVASKASNARDFWHTVGHHILRVERMV